MTEELAHRHTSSGPAFAELPRQVRSGIEAAADGTVDVARKGTHQRLLAERDTAVASSR